MPTRWESSGDLGTSFPESSEHLGAGHLAVQTRTDLYLHGRQNRGHIGNFHAGQGSVS